ncbi:hypothetical protein GCM10007881_37150 [Mesorhizobium huakuii]|nr:hypothetical protein GCM10007881_37150 [Mesorhizobium huakuii]
MAARVDRRDPFELDTDTVELGSYVGKPIRGPIEVYDQALHCKTVQRDGGKLYIGKGNLRPGARLCTVFAIRSIGGSETRKIRTGLDLPVTGSTTSASDRRTEAFWNDAFRP